MKVAHFHLCYSRKPFVVTYPGKAQEMEPVACTLAVGWEKGQVENQVRFLRGRLFVPKPDFDDLDALNDWPRLRCEELAHRPQPEQSDRMFAELFEHEHAKLRTLGRAFEGYVENTVRVRTKQATQKNVTVAQAKPPGSLAM